MVFDRNYEPVVAGSMLYIGSPKTDSVTALDTRALNDVGCAVNQHSVSAPEALLREVRDDAALQLAVDAVRREHLRDNQELGRAGGARRRRGRLGCLCAWRRL